MRLGILGGTFDPVHVGHLALAEASRTAFDLDRVLFVPTFMPPHKPEGAVASADDRLAMVRRAVEAAPHFAVSEVELERQGPSYTVDTLAELQRRHPGAELYFVAGADQVMALHTWRDPQRLVQLARVIAVTRPGYDLTRLEEQERRLGPAAQGRFLPLAWLELGLSSTDLRRLLAEGRSVRYLVPDRVLEYIEERRLYRD
ncbi:MAG: nicotinate-nucleotide adenylyltransferase [Bacillota bacterium]